MASKLFSLFDNQFKLPIDSTATDSKSLASISQKTEEQNLIIQKLQQFEVAESKVDYSDYANFVFFNSALDYFNITGEKILNEYPYDASRDVTDLFVQDLDGFQKYIVSVWPRRSSHLRFNPSVSASYVTIIDSGKALADSDDPTAQVGVLAPNTGSMTIEFWCNLSASNAGSSSSFIIQKTATAGDGYSVYVSGSKVVFRMSSGSTSNEVQAPFSNGATSYYAFVYDNTNYSPPQLTAYTGSVSSFPVAVASASCNFSGSILNGTANFYIGSGTLSGKTSVPLSGAIDEVRVWALPLATADFSGTYNVKAYQVSGLRGLWHFNESGSLNLDDGTNATVLDYSGRRVNGQIQRYFAGLRGSGSLIPFDAPDLILNYNAPEVQSLILDKQVSGSAYDRTNDNLITRLIPEQYIVAARIAANSEETTLIENFLYILGRHFDHIKVKIDQFTNVLRTNYTPFDQAPDALLEDVARFFGWEFTGNFLSADAFQYLLGKNVLANQNANQELDVKLYQIKNEFWKRVLINLMYLYKSKGTRESIEAFMRIYGVNKNFVRLKEYGYRPNVGIQTHRIFADKSVYALGFYTGSLTASITSAPFTGSALSVETRVLFPTTASLDNYPVVATGSIWSILAQQISGTVPSGSAFQAYRLIWQKNNGDTSQVTGSLIFSGTEGQVTLANVNIFDHRWYNIVCYRDTLSGTMNIDVRGLGVDGDTVSLHYTASLPITVQSASLYCRYKLGSTGSFSSQMWTQESRIWNKSLTEKELQDHALNFQSYGTEMIGDNTALALHWRLRENVTASADTSLPDPAIQSEFPFGPSGSEIGFQPSIAPYKKFLIDYNYIASPDFSWNEDRIRTYGVAELKPADVQYDNQLLALEFNMVDALNEDVSQIIATMDNFNNAIGLPVNRYRSAYQDIEVVRRQYFKNLQGRLNFRVFSDMLEFFDRSFITMIRRLIPARAVFLGDEFVVESHMLERPKLQWNYRRQTRPFMPEGVIKVYVRT